MADREGKPNLLRMMGLPLMESTADLAALTHLDSAELKRFIIYARHGSYYKIYSIPKRNGRAREINQPGRRLKGVQAWILRNVLDRLSPTLYATAFRPGCGIRQGVNPHIENRYFLCLDIEDFFPSIGKGRVEQIFSMVGYPRTACDILASLCTCKRRLPQGGVTSPALSNLVVARLDRRIGGFAQKQNFAYTRYADDLTISCNRPEQLPNAHSFITRIVRSEGFRINSQKTRFFGPRKHCRVIGLVKNCSESKFGVGKRKKRRMRAAFFNALIAGRFSEDYPSIDSLNGWLWFVKDVDPETFEAFQKYRNALEIRAAENRVT